MSILKMPFSFHQCFVFKSNFHAKYGLLSKAQICRHLCVNNFNCSAKLSCLQGKHDYTSGSPLTCEKWPGEHRIKVSRVFQRLKYIRLIKAAVRVGMPYPEQNQQLANLIEEMKKLDINVPTEQVIERTLDPKMRSGICEVAAPCGVLFILQYDTTDISHTEHLNRKVCQNYDFTYLGVQTQRHVFYDQKGILTTTLSERGMPLEAALEIAVKGGAESVSSKMDIDGKISLEIYCSPSNLHEVKRQLKNSFIIEEAFVGYIPKYLAKVQDSMKSKLADCIVDFSKASEIEMIYENVK